MIALLTKIWNWWTGRDNPWSEALDRSIEKDYLVEKGRKKNDLLWLKHFLGTNSYFDVKGKVTSADYDIARQIRSVPVKVEEKAEDYKISVREVRKEAEKYIINLLVWLEFKDTIREYQKIKKDFPFKDEVVNEIDDEPKIIIP